MNRGTEGKVYLRAAELLADRKMDRSCCAVDMAVNGSFSWSDKDTPERIRYTDAMLGTNSSAELFGWSEKEYDGPEAREIRILLLCFMAAMVEAGDAP